MSNKLKYLVLHCTATQEGKNFVGTDIRRMHTSPAPKGRGWKQVGYSDIILLSGEIENLVPYDENDIVELREITNGALGLNGVARHVSYIGGLDFDLKPKDTRTDKQLVAMISYVKKTISLHPDIQVLGHNQVAAKACPCFDVPVWLRAIGLEEKNIYKKANSL